ncbi:tetratricopeptide repeat protein [uncultured Eubacterium sp.]|uniref:tetratricopeptide repeat protein n=1 Tax=uncultured Eubacterium sp. TaxID=165185 RepID=UPI0025F1FDFB|nr:tetratricopeptide repeat protein [uncultured Eubacterium sp.]
MKEKITYSSDLKCFFDLCNRANSNNSVAQFDLAKLYLHINRENTNKKAFLLLKKLANQSYNATQTNAQYMLARCYEKGCGITKSYRQSAKWYRQAYINANNDIYKAFENEIDDIIDEALNEPESEEITPELIDCVTENAENGDSASQEYLANLYWRGDENIKANDEKFVYWAEKAARQGDYLSAFHLGRYYETKRQYKNASNWYKIAAELNIIRRNKITARNSSGNYIK